MSWKYATRWTSLTVSKRLDLHVKGILTVALYRLSIGRFPSKDLVFSVPSTLQTLYISAVLVQRDGLGAALFGDRLANFVK